MTDRPPPFPDSLCHRCQHLRMTGNTRGSIFLACAAPSLPRYLPQPVRRCAGWAVAGPDTVVIAGTPGAGAADNRDCDRDGRDPEVPEPG